MPREFTAVPAARSSSRALKTKQRLVIGGVLAAAAMGPLAFFVSSANRVDPNAITQAAVAQVQASSQVSDAARDVFALADLTVRGWAAGSAPDVPRLAGVDLAGGSLGVSEISRVQVVGGDLAKFGLDPNAYSAVYIVSYRAVRTNGSLVRIELPVAVTKPSQAVRGEVQAGVVLAAPSLFPYTAPLGTEKISSLAVPAGWTQNPNAATQERTTLLGRFLDAYAKDTLTSIEGVVDASIDPSTPDAVAARFAQLQQADPKARAYVGIGGLGLESGSVQVPTAPLDPTVEVDPCRELAKKCQVFRVRASFRPLAQGQPAPTGQPVRVELDVLINTAESRVLAWGPAGSGPTLRPYENHTAYSAWAAPQAS